MMRFLTFFIHGSYYLIHQSFHSVSFFRWLPCFRQVIFCNLILCTLLLQRDPMQETSGVFLIVFMLGILLLIFVAHSIYHIGYMAAFDQLHQETSRRQTYEKQVLRMSQHYEELQRYLHDMRNHLAVRLHTRSSDDAGYTVLGLPKLSPLPDTLEILIGAKRQQAKTKKVIFDFQYDELIEYHLSSRDIIALFGNVFDNAIKAAGKIRGGSVIGQARVIKGAIVIALENSAPQTLFFNRRPRRSATLGKGRGVSIIESVVLKHDGMMEYHQLDGKIRLEIILYPSIMKDRNGGADEMSRI